ncbi:MAG: hypothetical protein DLM70_00125, partial [Chloroflexi bacterium]
ATVGAVVAVGGAGVGDAVGGGGGGDMGVGTYVGGGGGVLAAASKCDVGEWVADAIASMPTVSGTAKPKVMRLFIQDSLRVKCAFGLPGPAEPAIVRHRFDSVAARCYGPLRDRPDRASHRSEKEGKANPLQALFIPPFTYAARLSSRR